MHRPIIFFILLAIAFSCKEKDPGCTQPRKQLFITQADKDFAYYKDTGKVIYLQNPKGDTIENYKVVKLTDTSFNYEASSDCNDRYVKTTRTIRLKGAFANRTLDLTVFRDETNLLNINIQFKGHSYSFRPTTSIYRWDTLTFNGYTFHDIYMDEDPPSRIYYSPNYGLVRYESNGYSRTLKP